MLVTSDEWENAGTRAHLLIAVSPDGTPHSLNADANPDFERGIVVFERRLGDGVHWRHFLTATVEVFPHAEREEYSKQEFMTGLGTG